MIYIVLKAKEVTNKSTTVIMKSNFDIIITWEGQDNKRQIRIKIPHWYIVDLESD